MENFAKENTIIFHLNENLCDQGLNKGDVISLSTLQLIMQTYAEVSVTVINIQ